MEDLCGDGSAKAERDALLLAGLPSNNVRVMPTELKEALLESSGEASPNLRGARSNSPLSAAKAEVRLARDEADQGEELPSRRELKEAATRFARKEARRIAKDRKAKASHG